MRRNPEDLFYEVGKKYGKPAWEVKREIEFMIEDVLAQADEETRKKWAKIPCKGEIPTPEELIVYLVDLHKR